MELIEFLQTKVFIPIWTALCAFYLEVLLPFWNLLTKWIEKYIPWCESFADYVTIFFKLKYKGRIYAFMLLVPVFFLLILISGIRSRIRRKRRRKRYAGTN